MLKKLLPVAAGLLVAFAAYAATVELADQHPARYTVKKGDTLWDISARFLKKPWLWPEIWQVNPQVRNPHLIYPGDELVLGLGSNGPGLSAIRARATPVDEAVPPIPLSHIKQFLTHTRILDDEELRNAPHVVGIEEDRLRGTSGQLVYVRGLDAQPGQRLALVRPIGRYYDTPPDVKGDPQKIHRQERDARDGRRALLWRHGPHEFSLKGRVRFLGYEMLDYATVEVTRAGNPASVLVGEADFEVRPGDFVLPIEERPYDDEYVPHPPGSVPDGMRVIAFTDALNAVGPKQVVALSRGAENGVENGQVYSIYHSGETVVDRTDYPENGARKFFNPKDAKVELPPEFVGHVLVFRTFDQVSYGLVMDTVKPIRIDDWLHDPDSTP